MRFTAKLNSQLGLVQEQRATVVAFLFHAEDQARYTACRPGELFKPRFRPAGIWLDVSEFKESPIWEEAMPFLADELQAAGQPRARDAHVRAWRARQRAHSLLLYRAVQEEFMWRSSETHTVRRTGFPLTHAAFLSSTSSQGQTLRKGTTIDCGRMESRGRLGLSDDQWWLHLYVMFSRVTCMQDMLLLRPPPRDVLERGPPPSVRKALAQFEAKAVDSMALAALLVEEFGLTLPAT